MKMRLELIGSFCFYFGYLVFKTFCISTEFPERQTIFGKVRGRVSERIIGSPVEEYLGIPFASPPVGAKRFQRPIKPDSWNDVLNTTRLPPACWQGKINAIYIKAHMPEFDINDQSEDCLYLNIFVPKSIEKNKTFPVMFYIHGGSNRAGMGAMLPGDLLAAHGQIIVINFNYRLGLLGFLSSVENNFPGNNGLLDQVLAMKWVNSNIQYFNGDVSSITIVGHSAGAGDTGLHLVSPLTKGLFKNAILMSGSPLAHWAMAMPNQYPGSNINSTILRIALNAADIRQISVQDLIAIESIMSKLLPFSVVPYPAVVDNYYLTEQPRTSFKNGDFHGEAFFLSFTADESFADLGLFKNASFPGFLVRYEPFYPKICNFLDVLTKAYSDVNPSGKRLIEAEADMLFYAGMMELADLLSDSEAKPEVTVLEYDIIMPYLNNPKWQGVNHGQDIFYLFGVPLLGKPDVNFTSSDVEASKAEMTLYSNFVKSGLFTSDGKTRVGSLYNKDSKKYNRMSLQGNIVSIEQLQNFRASKMNFWNNVVPNTNFTCNASSAAPRRVFHMSSFLLTPCELVLFFYVNKYL
uniref:Carboxylesterase type B domain-containing protein n=1 Tax=Magallana gigas TaxID=29159 RepID=A0A8W8ILD7_MAGGI|nr:neuroligin-4, X-linked [Crassostrea gigas]